MKKRLLVALMAAAMAATTLTACGGSKTEAPAAATTTPAEAPAPDHKAGGDVDSMEVEDVEEEEPVEEANAGGTTFEEMQEKYAELVKYRDQVMEFYASDEVAASEEVNSLLEEANSLIEELGEFTREEYESLEDPSVLTETMGNIVVGLMGTVEKMEAAEPAAEEADAEDENAALIAEMKEKLTTGFIGESDDGAIVYWATSEDGTMSVYIEQNTDGSINSAIGSVTNNGDGTYTLTDESEGLSMDFTLEEAVDADGDDCLLLTNPSGQQMVMYERDASVIIDMMSKL